MSQGGAIADALIANVVYYNIYYSIKNDKSNERL